MSAVGFSKNRGRGEVLKLVSFSSDGEAPRVGYLEGDEIHPLGLPGGSMLEFIEHGRSADRQPGGESVPLEEARLHAPVVRPGKIICIGLNYEDHAEETGAEDRKSTRLNS